MIILNSLLPVFAVIALGRFLRHCDITSDDFLKTSDRLIYYLFFPAMLFWKIGTPARNAHTDWSVCWAVLSALAVMWLLCLGWMWATRMDRFLRGTYNQLSFRFNTYVGMAVVLSSMGEEGVRQFGLIISLAIPFINLLVVPTLIWYSDRDFSPREKYLILGRAVISNPLILACVAGILYSRLNVPFPVSVENTFRLLSMVSLPMALISIGGTLTLSRVASRFRPSLSSSILKLLVLPLIGYAMLRLFSVDGVSLRAAMIYFALPTATSTYVLSSQLGSDLHLASAGIVLSTLLSFLSLSAVLTMFPA